MIVRKSNLKLVPPTDLILHHPPEEFKFNGETDPIMLSNIMHERMQELGGVGLSANQVGLNLKMFVMGIDKVKMTVINPELVSVSSEQVSLDEGCLTFPGVYMKVSRPVSAKVKYTNENKEVIEQELSGLTCRIFLHEFDHMMGTTFKNRVSQLKWDMAMKKKQKKTKKIAKLKVQQLYSQIRQDIKENQNGNHSV